ncbi:hypothetical protein ACQY0O_007860 [Thecaphora frezii]
MPSWTYRTESPLNQLPLVYTDAKLDDLLALHLLGQRKSYQRVGVVITGVQNTHKAHSVIRDFLGSVKNRIYEPQKFSVLVGQNPTLKPAPHEATWEHIPNLKPVRPAPSYTFKNLRDMLWKEKVDVFHIAPVSQRDISLLVDHDQPFDIELFHTTQGYNTLQFDPETGANLGRKAQADFVRNLQERLRKHRSGSRAILVATDKTKDTWLGEDGGTQPVRTLKEHFPEKHIDGALWDPFTLEQFEQVAKLARERNDIELANKIDAALPPEAWIQAWSVESVANDLRSRGYAKDDPLSAIQYARAYPNEALGEELSNYYRSLAEKDIVPYLARLIQTPGRPPDAMVYWQRFSQGIEPMFGPEGSIEAYDATHIMAVLHSRETGRLIPLAVVHPNGDTNQLAELKPYEEVAAKSHEYEIQRSHGYKIHPLPPRWAQDNFVDWIKPLKKLGSLFRPPK